CIQQIENLNSSGASKEDISSQAKLLLGQDPKYHKGFKYDHKKNADKMAMKELKEENKILTTDLSTINHPNIRAYIQSKQVRIM
ncbi:uncharacterized protein LOC120265249, partial [Dioscorea cayenensis subsp. rotundata]|uniref:Uncharacterized protein LOC120265249 n=1 Tax=Dioscorea cayennensis subsp. rotundata TaxID=55577 RepID=A0AB40BS47_DIOCR